MDIALANLYSKNEINKDLLIKDRKKALSSTNLLILSTIAKNSRTEEELIPIKADPILRNYKLHQENRIITPTHDRSIEEMVEKLRGTINIDS